MKLKKIALAALALLMVCSCQSEHRPARIAQSGETESILLCEMVRLLAQAQSEEVEIVTVEGGTSDLHPAIAGGTLELYPEYTGNAWVNVLNHEPPYEQAQFPELQEEYLKQGLEWEGMTQVEDYLTFAVTPDTATRYNLKTLSDLAKVSDQLVLGADSTWMERSDIYKLLSKTYDMHFKGTKNLPDELQYQQLKKGKIDVMPIHSTDGRLKAENMVSLEDDLGAVSHSVLGFVTSETMPIDYPWLPEILQTIGSGLTTEDLIVLKNQVDSNGWNPATAARAWLETKGLLEPGAAAMKTP